MDKTAVDQILGSPDLVSTKLLDLYNMQPDIIISKNLMKEYNLGSITYKDFFLIRFYQLKSDNFSFEKKNELIKKISAYSSDVEYYSYRGKVIGRPSIEIIKFEQGKVSSRYTVWPIEQ